MVKCVYLITTLDCLTHESLLQFQIFIIELCRVVEPLNALVTVG